MQTLTMSLNLRLLISLIQTRPPRVASGRSLSGDSIIRQFDSAKRGKYYNKGEKNREGNIRKKLLSKGNRLIK